jgi:hypothetical protein
MRGLIRKGCSEKEGYKPVVNGSEVLVDRGDSNVLPQSIMTMINHFTSSLH